MAVNKVYLRNMLSGSLKEDCFFGEELFLNSDNGFSKLFLESDRFNRLNFFELDVADAAAAPSF